MPTIDTKATTKPHSVTAWMNAALGPDLQNILRQSYDNAKVTIDLRRTSIFAKHPTKRARLFLSTINLQSCTIVWDSIRKLAYDIPKINFSTF